MIEYELHPLAEEEMNEAAQFYEGQLSGLGDGSLMWRLIFDFIGVRRRPSAANPF